MITFIPYTWQGKKYKTLAGLLKVVMNKYPDYSVSFDIDTMYLRNRTTNDKIEYHVERDHPIANAIADEPRK